jgi:hypothetical protein
MQRRSLDNGDPEARLSFVREYFGSEPRKLAKLIVLVFGTVLVVTVFYVALVGFDKWKTNVTEASHMIWASYTPAGAQTLLATPLGSPRISTPEQRADGLVPLTPTPSAGRQYVCRTCGRASLPVWTATGQPHCPTCQGLMELSPIRGRDGLSTGQAPRQVP